MLPDDTEVLSVAWGVDAAMGVYFRPDMFVHGAGLLRLRCLSLHTLEGFREVVGRPLPWQQLVAALAPRDGVIDCTALQGNKRLLALIRSVSDEAMADLAACAILRIVEARDGVVWDFNAGWLTHQHW